MKEIYYLLMVYKFAPELYEKNGKYVLRLHNPDHRYWTEFELGDKIRWSAGVYPRNIFKKNGPR